MRSAGQVFQSTADLLRQAEGTVATLEMGPFAVPLTTEQREAMDGFLRDALNLALPLVHLRSDHEERATVILNDRRAHGRADA
jgi:hypothetical protein